MSPPASSASASRRRPAESDVYTWLLVLSALSMLTANIVLFIPLRNWYGFMNDGVPAGMTGAAPAPATTSAPAPDTAPAPTPEVTPDG